MKKIILTVLLISNLITIASEQNEIISSTDFNTVRADAPKNKPMWTQPLIIDANNRQFDTTNIVQFQENVIYKPSLQYIYPPTYVNYPAAIIIAKDNVTIDLAGFTLSLDPASTPNIMINQPIYGIAVLPGVKNVKIISSTPLDQKGCIFGFSSFAIYLLGIAQSYANFDIYSNMIKNIIINNLLISQNVNGICVANALEATITNTNVIYNYSPRPLYGIYFLNVLDGVINSCKINQNFSYSDMYGIYLQDTVGITVQNSTANINRSLKNGHAIGMNITASTAITSHTNVISNCISDRNLCGFVTGKKSIGFNISNQSHHNNIENCSSFGNSHSPSFAGAPAPGTYPQGIGFQIDSSHFNRMHQNKSGYHDTYGFYDTLPVSTSFFTSNISMLNAIANFNVTIPTPSGTEPLPTIVISQNDLTNYVNSGPVFANIEAQSI